MHELKRKFEGKALADYPETTRIRLNLIGGGAEYVEVPTAEVFQPGDWLARRFAGIKFSLCERAMRKRNVPLYNVKTFAVESPE